MPASKDPPSKLAVGQILVDMYRLDRLIAEGGMGSVWEASHVRVPKRFAIKFLHAAQQSGKDAALRFRREAEIIARLDHPNIVNLFDYNVTDDGVPYMVLEYLDGQHLGERLKGGPVPLDETVIVLRQTAAALAAAHALGVVHRDLKPENIVLCKGDVVKVVDFGIAKIYGQDMTRVNSIIGTVPYMSPEQVGGGVIDARSDQFSLAAVLYEMLSGTMAFGGFESVPEVAMRVMHHEPPAIPQLPPGVNEALRRALSKKAAQRFPSLDDFVRAVLEGRGTLPALPSPSGPSAALVAAVLGDVAPPPDEVAPRDVKDALSPRARGDVSTDEGLPPLAAASTKIIAANPLLSSPRPPQASAAVGEGAPRASAAASTQILPPGSAVVDDGAADEGYAPLAAQATAILKMPGDSPASTPSPPAATPPVEPVAVDVTKYRPLVTEANQIIRGPEDSEPSAPSEHTPSDGGLPPLSAASTAIISTPTAPPAAQGALDAWLDQSTALEPMTPPTQVRPSQPSLPATPHSDAMLLTAEIAGPMRPPTPVVVDSVTGRDRGDPTHTTAQRELPAARPPLMLFIGIGVAVVVVAIVIGVVARLLAH